MSIYASWKTIGLGLIIAIVVSQWPVPIDAARPPPIVIVNKCCRIGEQMDVTRRCLVGGTEKWWPPVYQIQKAAWFMPPGEAPRFLKVREQYMPVCENVELFIGANKLAVFSNGSLLLSERNAFFDPDSYCVDKDAALVCMPRPQGADSLTAPRTLTRVNKCCPGLNLAYDIDKKQNPCVTLGNGHDSFSKKTVSNTTAIDLVFGFPHCEMTNHYTIAGMYKQESLEVTTGSLTLDSGRQFTSKEYCLDHIVSDVDMTAVNVFTCAEHFTDKSDSANQVSEIWSHLAGAKFVIKWVGNGIL